MLAEWPWRAVRVATRRSLTLPQSQAGQPPPKGEDKKIRMENVAALAGKYECMQHRPGPSQEAAADGVVPYWLELAFFLCYFLHIFVECSAHRAKAVSYVKEAEEAVSRAPQIVKRWQTQSAPHF